MLERKVDFLATYLVHAKGVQLLLDVDHALSLESYWKGNADLPLEVLYWREGARGCYDGIGGFISDSFEGEARIITPVIKSDGFAYYLNMGSEELVLRKVHQKVLVLV